MKRFELGVGAALFAAMAGSIILCGILVHLTWSRAADVVTRNLLGALENPDRRRGPAGLVGAGRDHRGARADDVGRHRRRGRSIVAAAPRRSRHRGFGSCRIRRVRPIRRHRARRRRPLGRPPPHRRRARGRGDRIRRRGSGDLAGGGARAHRTGLAADRAGEAVPRGAVGYVRTTPAGTLVLALTFERFAEQLAVIPVGRHRTSARRGAGRNDRHLVAARGGG
jgi:hypothetical protein